MRSRDELVREVRPPLPHRRLQRLRKPVRGCVGEQHEHEQPWTPAEQRERERKREPHGAPASDTRQPDEDVVERRGAVLDDPALETVVQTGTSCFVLSTSCCRSKGFPTNPCAPRLVACSSACSSTLPLNITTGIAPTP